MASSRSTSSAGRLDDFPLRFQSQFPHDASGLSRICAAAQIQRKGAHQVRVTPQFRQRVPGQQQTEALSTPPEKASPTGSPFGTIPSQR